MGQTISSPSTPTRAPAATGGCPVPHKSTADTSASCPIKHDAPASAAPAQCPIDHEGVNPLNQMPQLAHTPAPNQTILLPTERTESSIPRDRGSKWDYPSPQQFYNALVRKGWETPEEHVETMVEIHNFLNERAWMEVLKWEKRQYEHDDIQLARFKGRPGEMSPKARFWMFAGWLLPARFNSEPPFDRHDWVVRRPKTGEEVRYVIDYYSAPPESDGSPVFSLDVRPALDNLGSVKERIAVATEEVWANFRHNQRPDHTVREPK
ncbi:Cytochrome c heme lyase [Hypsizygus marmoreus]|uniref:Holocytochrome c-type synthase n=1 Tax=Hypsizygus marmoreus TaxID=39966 RepID=A0A369J8Q4_HYPMA|nr:Cytochrome c heme lyase [Hypsizygus marmoreus]